MQPCQSQTDYQIVFPFPPGSYIPIHCCPITIPVAHIQQSYMRIMKQAIIMLLNSHIAKYSSRRQIDNITADNKLILSKLFIIPQYLPKIFLVSTWFIKPCIICLLQIDLSPPPSSLVITLYPTLI